MLRTVNFNQSVRPRHLLLERTVAWKCIAVEHLKLLPREATYASQQVVVAIVLGQPFQLDWQFNSDRKRFGQWMHPGDCHILPQSSTFQLNCYNSSRLFLMAIEPDWMASTVQPVNFDTTEITHHLGTSDPGLRQFGQLIRAELEVGGLGGQLYLESLTAALSVHLLRHYSTARQIHQPIGGLPQHKLRQVIDYIHNSLDQELRLTDLAAIVQISPNYFATLFKQSTGVAPHQFIIQCRVERAKLLLQQRNLTIS
jgi:AraC family transcriptional regulator